MEQKFGGNIRFKKENSLVLNYNRLRVTRKYLAS